MRKLLFITIAVVCFGYLLTSIPGHKYSTGNRQEGFVTVAEEKKKAEATPSADANSKPIEKKKSPLPAQPPTPVTDSPKAAPVVPVETVKTPQTVPPSTDAPKAPVPNSTPDVPTGAPSPSPTSNSAYVETVKSSEPQPTPKQVYILIDDPTDPPSNIEVPTSKQHEIISAPPPEYPEKARNAKVNGSVILQLLVRKDGKIGRINVLKANPENMGFEVAAVASVQKWKFKPALDPNGNPVAVWVTQPLRFKLK